MEADFVAARIGLSAVFAAAGIAKMLDLSGSAKTLLEFGFHSRFTAPLSIIIAVSEMSTAALLISAWSAQLGAAISLALLTLFTSVIAVNLRRGRTPECRCFGKVHSHPIGWRNLAFNGVLFLVTVYIFWRSAGNPPPTVNLGQLLTLQMLWLLVATLTAVVLAGFWFLFELFRQNGRLLLRIDALEGYQHSNVEKPFSQPRGLPSLPTGGRAPSFRLPNHKGIPVGLEELTRSRKPVILIFTNVHCGPCRAMEPALCRWQADYGESITLVLVSDAMQREATLGLARNTGIEILLQERDELAKIYGALGTPAAFLIHSDGTIGSPVKMGSSAIEQLVMTTVSEIIRPKSHQERVLEVANQAFDDNSPPRPDFQNI